MKITDRDKYVIVGIIVLVISYLLYTYLYVPLKEEKDMLTEELSTLTPKMQDISKLKTNVIDLSTKKKVLVNSLLSLKEEKGFDNIPYKELITYLGSKADELDLDITLFTKMDLNDRGEYKEIPYDIKVEGNYSDITNFVNNLYELDTYFFITDIEMKEIDVLPIELMVKNDDVITMPFDWAENFISRVDKGIPTEYILEYSEEIDPYTLEQKINKKTELSFKFYFVSLDE